MRTSSMDRTTNETTISAFLNLDGSGKGEIDSGVGFFDHMLTLFAAHSGFDITVKCKGDTAVDAHHSVEDIGIVLGKLFCAAIADKKGIKRFASKKIPMDEALAEAVVDISGRGLLVYNAELSARVGDFDLELVEEFFRAFAVNAQITLHLSLLYGKNNHHKAEALFKATARSLKSAARVVSDIVPSTKGIL